MHNFFAYRRKAKETPMEVRTLQPPHDADNSSFRKRFSTVFGDFWILNFIFPQPWFVNRLSGEDAQVLLDATCKDM
jgi:hypothetical protein